ncbi:16S rRNA (guanine(527)-N(7))-methyltransferase RsmG [Alkalihalobacillus sp. LMS39]|uniref:16S rRNA (guanine(527)-N(7))-methyltransferase RsmG n=1 Tax=Alkalihalobacillus sp. LMS39 TaxID=2924032 RepID=UPI001FB40C6A|nr:16S rRNA (guanine(527)-N(7))-methyltransferase RsmG [Alkalihalobacillus sp. LMS39]UOE94135.1 16S rRNA (guanine(527)-N(7))-methyltransferase RsmG [Alkalihalobacillus sp. LMS39]
MSKQQFPSMLKEQGIELSEFQLQQFHLYYKILVEWNEKMNLTAITNEDDVYIKHFYDSITAAFHFDFTRSLSIIDVGAGAGFPSIPIKICFPSIQVNIVDSLNKRIGFLEHLAKELQLEQCHFYHDRAETFGQNPKHREQYDVCLARAVARMPVLSELCLPLVKKEGYFIAMKGPDGKKELKEAKKALSLLGGKVEKEIPFHLPIEESERFIAVINKSEKTPKKYPRKPGTPNKQPIE